MAVAWALAWQEPVQSAEAVQLALTSPRQLGAVYATSQPPVHLASPSHLTPALAEILQPPEQLPLQVAPALGALHLPSQVPAQLALDWVPSHLPSQVPSQPPVMVPSQAPEHVPSQATEALAEPSHVAPTLQLPLQEPEIWPGSQDAVMSALQEALPLHSAVQEPCAEMSASHFTSPWMLIEKLPAAFTWPMTLTAALHAAVTWSSVGVPVPSHVTVSLPATAMLRQDVATSTFKVFATASRSPTADTNALPDAVAEQSPWAARSEAEQFMNAGAIMTIPSTGKATILRIFMGSLSFDWGQPSARIERWTYTPCLLCNGKSLAERYGRWQVAECNFAQRAEAIAAFR